MFAKTLKAVLLAMAASAATTMAAAAIKRPEPPPCSAWQDTFQTLDLNRWTLVSGNAPGYSSTNISVYESSNIQLLRPGVLRLTLTQVAGTVNGIPGTYSYGALIQDNEPCGYGTYQWTMKMSSTALCGDSSCTGQAVSGSVSAGFIFANNSQTEIDFEFEGWNGKTLYMANWFNSTPLIGPFPGNEAVTPYTRFNPIDGQHVYKFVWTEREISYYVDGQLVVTHTQNVPKAPAYFMINHWGTNGGGWGETAVTGVARHMYVTQASYTPLKRSRGPIERSSR